MILLQGIVQGVGLRPAVHRLARELGLVGLVRNEQASVRIEVEGAADDVESFVERLPAALPPLARIDSSTNTEIDALGESAFRIAAAAADAAGSAALGQPIPPDLAPCDDCVREMEDPANRRHRYPFVSCTACGPRYTIVTAPPYDRVRTSMEPFPFCEACAREYEDPEDRRFHSQTDSCPACGPRISLYQPGAAPLSGERALEAALAVLRAGAILAVQGAGGIALACDATSDEAVSDLRARKHRLHKPFAVMGRSLAALEEIVELSDLEREALLSPARPIVLARARSYSPLSAGVAPGLADVGVFLPPTPLQRILLSDGPPLQVMTSGNVAGAPIARDGAEAMEKLSTIADAFLLHDRAVVTRADDSVARELGGGITLLRRARGFVPAAIPLPLDCPPLLAVGAGEKNTVCLAVGRQAFLSPHLGDLDHPDAWANFHDAIERLERLHGCRPVAVAHDLHPDLRATRWAHDSGLRCIPVQHHHAHVAACMVEHGRTEKVLGVAFDGTGLGDDGGVWGGEFLVADLQGFDRVGHLRRIALAGGEAAIREPWRLAVAALLDAACPPSFRGAPEAQKVDAIARLVDGAPRATGAGRWFDAVAALCGLRAGISYEGQAALELEAAAC
ncbi:MAG TPA: carbamoyltransferase HypF, partial [Vulgatibacter sp.]